jgi:pyruvate dehydrogenase E2 component (dihydrolipoamide acetyltransferase)
VGDTVTVNQIIVEIETAKAAVELPSPYAGTVAALLVEPGVTVEVGSPIIAISDGADEPAAAPAPTAPAPAEPPATAAEPAGAKIGEPGVDGRIANLVGYGPKPGSVTRRARKSAPTPSVAPAAPAAPAAAPAPTSPRVGDSVRVSRDSRQAAEPSASASTAASTAAPTAEPTRTAVPLAKPPVRKLARELGIDLGALTGSGPNGVITRDDVRTGGAPAANGATAAPAPASAGTGGERRVPIKGVRKATASAMVSSAFTAPHVTEFLAVDVTPMIELRDRLRASAAFSGVKLSPLTFAAKAVCLAARRTPEVNASWDDAAQEIVYYDHVQLGIAAATPRGLVVPKIRDADTLSLRGLAEALGELTVTARAGKTSPAEMLGGTFTITNVGVFGVDTGTPILNPGESAILALGAVKKAPWVVDGQLAVRTVCQLALSFDHRVVDGEQGSRFLADVGALLADPGLALTY